MLAGNRGFSLTKSLLSKFVREEKLREGKKGEECASTNVARQRMPMANVAEPRMSEGRMCKHDWVKDISPVLIVN